MRRWPKEAPIFEVTLGGAFAKKGSIIELIEVPGVYTGISGASKYLEEGWMGVRILSRAGSQERCLHPDGWRCMAIGSDDVRPLTPFAGELLKLVRQ